MLSDCKHNLPNFKQAGIGRNDDVQVNPSIRKDSTLWFDENSVVQNKLLVLMNELQAQLNRCFYLGLSFYECHYAFYKKGDYYLKHFDAFKGQSNRIITTVLYLNTPKLGGELVLYDETSQVLKKITPKAGTLVVFESERFEHEVLSAESDRFSVSGWFRR